MTPLEMTPVAMAPSVESLLFESLAQVRVEKTKLCSGTGRSRTQSHDRDLQRQPCNNFKTQQIPYRDFRIKIIYPCLKYAPAYYIHTTLHCIC
jgi:hypothetical protein